MTKPFFFADSNEQLFGIQTLPDDDKANAWGALICYPLGQEYLRSYQAMQRLAVELAKKGLYVMRFDYYGTGDSAGDRGYADPLRCREDIGKAVSEFRDTCNIDLLALIGLRMGANLAAHVQEVDIDRLVLLDPVISGSKYISDLEAMHESLVLDPDRYPLQRSECKGSSANELIGFGRDDKTIESFARFDLNRLRRTDSPEVVLLVSSEDRSTKELSHRWQDLGMRLQYQHLESDGNWNSLELIEEPLQYWPIIRRSAELFS